MIEQLSYKSLLFSYGLVKVRLRAKQFKSKSEIQKLIDLGFKIENELCKRIDNGEMI